MKNTEEEKEYTEEEVLLHLISDTKKIYSKETDTERRYLYYNMISYYSKKLNGYRNYKKIRESDNKETFGNVEKLFKKFNSYAFAGFDFYHLDGLKKVRKDKCATMDVLINEEHLDKLEKVINCDKELGFYDDLCSKYGIVLNDTKANINLIPFERTKEGIIIEGKDGNVLISNKELKEAFGEQLQEYQGYSYRKLFKPIKR